MSGIASAVIGSAVVGGIASNRAAKKGAEAMDRATEANAWQGEIAKDQYEDYKTTYRPLEQDLVAQAKSLDTQEARDKAAAEAQADVSSQIGLAQERLRRTPGLDPSSAASAAAQTNLALKGAAIGATAQNAARTQTADKAYARKFDAVGLGKGLVTNAANGAAQAAATAQGIAGARAAQAGATAQGVGSLVGTGINALSKMNWGTGATDLATTGSAGNFDFTPTALDTNPGALQDLGWM